MRFSAKVDPWAVCLIVTAAIAAVGLGIYFIVISHGEVAGIAGGIVMLLAGVAMAGFLMFTAYKITSSHVVLWPLPFRLIRIDEILEAVPVNNISATLRVASSSQAVRITGSKRFCGCMPPTVSISPRDRAGFLQTLADASPDLELADDGSVRRRV